MYKIVSAKEEMKDALLDYYNGCIAIAKREAEALYDIAYNKINGGFSEVYSKGFEKSEDDMQQLSFLMKCISEGFTKEEYVQRQVTLIREQINKKLVSGDLSEIKFPSKQKIAIEKMHESDEKKADRISNAIVAGVKKMDLLFGGAMSLIGFVWPGIFGAFKTMDLGTENWFLGYISGAILFSTLCNIPNIIKFIKGFTASYKKDEKLDFLNKYYQVLVELGSIEVFFKDLAEEFKLNIPKIYDSIDMPKRR